MESVLTALKELLVAGMALVMSLTGAAGGNSARVQPAKTEKRQVQVVPRLPVDAELTVDENENEVGDVEEEETEEVGEEDLDGPVSIQYITLRGPIGGRPEDGTVGTWTIAGREVEVTDETHVSTRAANAKIGEWAQVQAEVPDLGASPVPTTTSTTPTATPTTAASTQVQLQEQAPLVARSIAVMSSQNLARIVGIIESLDAGATTPTTSTTPAPTATKGGDKVWVVSGVRVKVTAETRIVGTPAVGRLADVHGGMDVTEPELEATVVPNATPSTTETVVEVEPSGEFVAKLIVVRGTPNLPKQKEAGKKFDLTGLVEEIVEIDADTSEWVVAGQTVLVNDDTVLVEKKGKAEVGATVRVQTTEVEDEEGATALVATRIEVLRAAQVGKPNKGLSKKTVTPAPEGVEQSVQPRPTKTPRPSQGKGQERKN